MTNAMGLKIVLLNHKYPQVIKLQKSPGSSTVGHTSASKSSMNMYNFLHLFVKVKQGSKWSIKAFTVLLLVAILWVQ